MRVEFSDAVSVFGGSRLLCWLGAVEAKEPLQPANRYPRDASRQAADDGQTASKASQDCHRSQALPSTFVNLVFYSMMGISLGF